MNSAKTISSLRTPARRGVVRLPFKAGPPIAIGDSLQIATTLYARTEGSLQSHPEISRPYYVSIASFVMPESSIYDLNTDSALCDFAGAPATIADSARDEGHSLADRVSVPKCVYCIGSHGLEDCGKFLLSSVEQRSTLARAM